MHYENLSLRHQTFLSEYVQNGFNAGKAYRDVYLSDDRAVSDSCASRLLSNEKVQLALAELVAKITPDYILSMISSIALDAGARNSDKLRALELLGKYHALFKDSTQNLNLHAITVEELDNIRKKLPVKSKQAGLTDNTQNIPLSTNVTEAVVDEGVIDKQ